MNEINSSSQIAFILLFQLCLRLLSEPFDLFIKAFLFILADVLMVMVVAAEWFRFEVEWQKWIQKVSG